MIRRLLSGYLAITVALFGLLGWPLATLYARHERERLVNAVRLDATEVATFAALPLASSGEAALQPIVDRYAASTDGRMVILDRRGVSVADSHDTTGRSFRERPEVAEALRGHVAEGFRRSESLDLDLYFVSVPVNGGGEIVGCVRVTYPASYLDDRIHRSWLVLAGVGAAVVIAVSVVSWSLARAVAHPVNRLEEAARRLGEGDLEARVAVPAGPPELASLAVSFNETAAKLERLVRAQEAFVADASHQLRTPLTAMRLSLENLKESSDAVTSEAIAATLGELHRLTRIVDGLLALARATGATSVRTSVDVDQVIATRVAHWTAYADEQGVSFRVDGRAGHALVTPGHLEQALDNLVANAIDASPRGGVVAFESRRNAHVEVDLVDEGPGMTEGQRRDAFLRFHTTKASSRGSGGFGLGLAIARQLVVGDGGDLVLAPAPSGGVAARLTLPAAPPPAGRSGRLTSRRSAPVP